MRSVNIAELKAQLSAHLQFVRDGEEVIVCDRNRPVARIIPCQPREQSEQEQRLIACGLMTPPMRRRSSRSWPQPPGDISDGVMTQIWREERQSR